MSSGKKKRNYSRCFICGNKDGESSITHFRFPTKDKDTRCAWFNFINVPEEEDSNDDTSLRLCNKHFADEHLTKVGYRYRLREGAVPTLLSSVSKRPCTRRVRCVLCGFKEREDDDIITTSSFPVDMELRRKWATFCGLPIESVTCSSFLCSKHFQEDDFIKKRWMKEQPKKILKSTATPSIHLENEITSKGRSSQKRRFCQLCGHSENDRPYFKFPKKDEKNKKWRDVCRLRDGIDTSKLRICGHHFAESDKIVRLTRTDLKDKALPIANSGTCPELSINSNENKNITVDPVTDVVLSDVSDLDMSRNNFCSASNESDSVALPEEDNVSVTLMNQPSQAIEHEASSIINNSQNTTEETRTPTTPRHNCDTTLPHPSEDIRTPDPGSSDCTKRIIDENMRTPTLPRNCPRKTLRFFGDVRTPDLASPRRAKMCWGIARRTIALKNQQIKRQQETITRLRQKISSLTDLIEHLRSKQFISENTAQLLTSMATFIALLILLVPFLR